MNNRTMKRNRILSNIIAVLGAIAIAAIIALFATSDTITGILVGTVVGGFFLGFIGYRYDGVKIAAIIAFIGTVLGIILGVTILKGGGKFLAGTNSTLVTLGVALGLALSIVIIGVILIVLSIIGGIALILTALIGAALGELVWKDKKSAISGTTQVVGVKRTSMYPAKSPSNNAYIVCPYCGARNNTEATFCVNYGAKLK